MSLITTFFSTGLGISKKALVWLSLRRKPRLYYPLFLVRLCRKNTGWLECNSDETIFIDKAWYARWYEVLCNTGRWFDKHYCEGTKVDFVLQDICRGKQNCRIKATTRFLGISDPCYFSNEYLEIYYTCKRGKFFLLWSVNRSALKEILLSCFYTTIFINRL